MKYESMTYEMFDTSSDDLGIERAAQPIVGEIVLPDGPATMNFDHLANDAFNKAVSGADDVVDDAGRPCLGKHTAPTMTLAQRTAQAISKSVNAVFPKVMFINASASARKARIAEILDKAKQSLRVKGYATDGDGWPALAKHADEFVVSILMEV